VEESICSNNWIAKSEMLVFTVTFNVHELRLVLGVSCSVFLSEEKSQTTFSW
jgi:hypothetical protein